MFVGSNFKTGSSITCTSPSSVLVFRNRALKESIDVTQVCDAAFEQEFQDQRYTQWIDYYLDFSEIGSSLKVGSSPSAVAKLIELEWFKVHDFFLTKRSEIERRLAACHLLKKEDNVQLLEQVKIAQSDIHRLYHYSRLNYLGFLRLFMHYDTLFDTKLSIHGFEDLSALLFEWVYEINGLIKTRPYSRPSGPLRKYWLHPDNLLEVMLYLSWRAAIQTGPAFLLYPATHDETATGTNCLQEIISVYYDTPSFKSYSERISNDPYEFLLRIRDYGQKGYVAIEQKGSGETLKPEKNLTHKSLGKIPQYLSDPLFSNKQRKIDSRRWIKKESLDLTFGNRLPVLKTTQRRTVFQTDQTTIYIDTEIVIMQPEQPMSEGDMFPYCIVQVMGEELEGLHTCALLEPIHDFSIYLHGVGSLFSDKVHIYPHWLQSPLGDDLRRIPFRGDLLLSNEKKKRFQNSLTINTDSCSSTQSSTIHTPWSSSTIATIVTSPDTEKCMASSLYSQDYRASRAGARLIQRVPLYYHPLGAHSIRIVHLIIQALRVQIRVNVRTV
ncbi:hypothetical protein BY458DRAFT_543757 [Sporodiniella umbellata]|nr:hypothetical protein BY458DRAFT_543757 [Sporodiniella umbellata]